MIYNFKSENQLEQIVYLLAIMVSGSYDADETNDVYNSLLNCRYEEIFGFGLFFFKSLSNGKRSEQSFLNKLKLTRLTNTAQ